MDLMSCFLKLLLNKQIKVKYFRLIKRLVMETDTGKNLFKKMSFKDKSQMKILMSSYEEKHCFL